MVEWFTESALFPACIGLLLTVVFVGLAFSSGEMVMVKIAMLIASLTAVLVIVEVMIVTDKEQIENTIHEMAAAMQENEFDRVMNYLATDDLKQRARSELRGAKCHFCRITAINEVNVAKDGESANVDFVAYAKASNKSFPQPTPVQARIKLFFEKQSEVWRVVDFDASNPRAGLKL